jgi:hypothetical protein
MNILNIVRILFIYGRDKYERATLSSKEYERRQSERAQTGCLGCLVVMVGLIFLFAWAVSVEDKREQEPEMVPAPIASSRIETQEEAWQNAAKSEGPTTHVAAVLTEFHPMGTFDAEYWFWTSDQKSLLLTYRRGNGWPPWPGDLPGPDDLGRHYDIEYREVNYLKPADNYYLADKHVVRCIGGAIDAELHRQLRHRVR